MKTTVDIDDDLLVAAKKHAAHHRKTLRALIEEGLRAQLTLRRARPKTQTVDWVVVDGGLPPGLDPSDRAAMSEWLRSERDAAT